MLNTTQNKLPKIVIVEGKVYIFPPKKNSRPRNCPKEIVMIAEENDEK